MVNIQEIGCRAILTAFEIIGLIPRKYSIRLADRMGHFFFLVDKKHRKIAIENLTNAFGHEKSQSEIRSLAKKVFGNLTQIIFEIGWSVRLDEKRLLEHFDIEGFSNMKTAYEKGRGVLALTAHLGNWELLSVIGKMLSYPHSMVYRPLDFKMLDRFFFNLRTRFGGKLIPQKRSLRAILRSLDRGEMVLLLMDQNVDWYEGVFAEFMGRRACTNKGLALLALKTEAPVVPIFLVRGPRGFVGKVFPEIPLIKTGDKTKDVEENTAQYNRAIESLLNQYPEQWLWLHQRWKTKPFHPWPREVQ
jgi:KDO2-lipid IV(A) lauroyltransferase